MTELRMIATSIVKQVKFLVELLEVNGFKTTEGSLKSEDIEIEIYSDIRAAFNEWNDRVSQLSIKERILETKVLRSMMKGTVGYEFNFKRTPGSQLGTLELTNKYRGNHYEIKIHPYGK